MGSVMEMFWGGTLITLVLACILTLIGGFVLLVLYRRAVDRLMKATASTGQRSAASMLLSPSTGANLPNQLAMRSLPATRVQRGFKVRSLAIAGAMRTRRTAALVQIAAGCAFAVVATVLLLYFSELGYNPGLFALIFWSWGWPVVLVLVLLWGTERKKTALVFAIYFGGLLLLCSPVALNNPINKLFESIYPLLFSWTRGTISFLFLSFFLNRAG